MTFLVEFARSPLIVGAVAPSGRSLAEVVTAPVPRTGDPLVVELGPGTGSFTAAIQRRLAGRGRHVAVEINPRFAARLSRAHPGVEVVAADARDLSSLVERPADVVVSGLPWAAFSPTMQGDALSAIARSLKPGGAFTTFAYVHARWAPPARRLLRSLRSHFDEVVVGRTVWANLPPALVYHCRTPLLPPYDSTSASTTRAASASATSSG
ncbi:methyltransferase domain-containing protein [Actinoplanes bogorensis]|uniref:Methyltransferase domain-containing protein n=1 Tax=Paractinoplanes bogorensis TaxID=1610840 RepID=A0ABS5YMD3_9ACTN|nr:methyltransferase domain-containing protein [Actinoplanes bogorensis]MBU2664580.1 methyltransferase domain-containing protein [Actinoplanes bogorensis]